jgi:hypothetical protein
MKGCRKSSDENSAADPHVVISRHVDCAPQCNGCRNMPLSLSLSLCVCVCGGWGCVCVVSVRASVRVCVYERACVRVGLFLREQAPRTVCKTSQGYPERSEQLGGISGPRPGRPPSKTAKASGEPFRVSKTLDFTVSR